jgi:ppGpp synthetase/RelA/SpoT-type nucleotidyltranferase
MAAPSNKTIDKAGTRLRDWHLAGAPEEDIEDPDFLAAGELVLEYRASMAPTLAKVTVGVRQFIASESSQVIVAQRLKRLPTILDKLARHPNMKLTRMQDIGGCRAILPGGLSEVVAVIRRMRKNSKTWQIRSIDDYGAEPRSTGYRAVHVTVERDGRLVEIQLRTRREHAWAVAVEQIGSRNGFPYLKDGKGPDDLLAYFRFVARLFAMQDRGITADDKTIARFQKLHERVAQTYTLS